MAGVRLKARPPVERSSARLEAPLPPYSIPSPRFINCGRISTAPSHICIILPPTSSYPSCAIPRNERFREPSFHAHHQHALTPLARRPSTHLAASTTPGHDRIPPLQPPTWPAHRRPLALEFLKRSTSKEATHRACEKSLTTAGVNIAAAHSAEASIAAVTNVLVSASRSLAMELGVLRRGSCLLLRDTAWWSRCGEIDCHAVAKCPSTPAVSRRASICWTR